jgi:hypothetical protein
LASGRRVAGFSAVALGVVLRVTYFFAGAFFAVGFFDGVFFDGVVFFVVMIILLAVLDS